MYYVGEMTTTKKTAVDQVAAKYWQDYFGDYGALWVKDVPRYIRAAIEGDLRKAAAVGTPPPVVTTDDRVTPLGYAITADRLTLEGNWTGMVRQGRRVTRQARLFAAEFTHDGTLVGLTAKPAPAA